MVSEHVRLRPGGPALGLAEVEGGCHCGAVRFRARLAQGLEAAGLELDADTAAGLYLWARDPEAVPPDSWDLVSRFAGAGILVAPGDFYGAAGRGRVRIALTATDERIEAAASRLEAAGDAFLKD